MHPMERAKLIKTWKEAVWWHYKGAYAAEKQPASIITIKLPFAQNRRRDPHNYCGSVLKAVIDGMVMAGAWHDDTPEYVGHREPVLYKGEIVYVRWTPMSGDSGLV